MGTMKQRILRSIGRFFEGTGDVLGTPSGDARGLIRVYTNETVTRGRSF
jgi:hypothetical protein